MKVVSYSYPHSSFLAVEKDMNIIVNHFMKNDRLKRLLWYDMPDALIAGSDYKDSDRQHIVGQGWRNLTDAEAVSMFGHQIKIVPKLKVEKPEFCYVVISFDNFTPNMTNPAFRDNIVSFDIVCHFDQWNLGDFQLRPYKIAAELDSMFNNKKLSGIGTLNFLGCNQIVLSDEFAGLTIMYQAIHGNEGEDSTNPLKPSDVDSIVDSYNSVFNNPNVL